LLILATLGLLALALVAATLNANAAPAAPTWDAPTTCEQAVSLVVWDQYDLPDGHEIVCDEKIDDQLYVIELSPKSDGTLIEFYYPGSLIVGFPSQLDYWIGHPEPENADNCDITTSGDTRSVICRLQGATLMSDGVSFWVHAPSILTPTPTMTALPCPIPGCGTPTPTATITATATLTPTVTVTPSVTPTATPTSTSEPTASPSPTASATATATPSATPSETPTQTATATATTESNEPMYELMNFGEAVGLQFWTGSEGAEPFSQTTKVMASSRDFPSVIITVDEDPCWEVNLCGYEWTPAAAAQANGGTLHGVRIPDYRFPLTATLPGWRVDGMWFLRGSLANPDDPTGQISITAPDEVQIGDPYNIEFRWSGQPNTAEGFRLCGEVGDGSNPVCHDSPLRTGESFEYNPNLQPGTYTFSAWLEKWDGVTTEWGYYEPTGTVTHSLMVAEEEEEVWYLYLPLAVSQK